MDKTRSYNEIVRFNYFSGVSRYVLLTGKTGYPSAAFRLYQEKGVVVEDLRHNSAGPADE